MRIRIRWSQWLLGWLVMPLVYAGGGPENVLVIVNARSPMSLSIANAYVHLREIPATHVVWLDDIPTTSPISLEKFRQRIWLPIRAYIERNNLTSEIDIIAYSADFPYSVNFSRALKNHSDRQNRYIGKIASLTGLTFFAHHVEREETGYLGLNRYFRRGLTRNLRPPRQLTEAEQKMITRGEKAVKKGECDKAIKWLQQVLADFPWQGGAWHELARCQAQQGNDKAALASLTKAVDRGWSHSLTTRVVKQFKHLRQHPRFLQLIAQMQALEGPFQPSHGFDHNYVWTGATEPDFTNDTDSLGQYYLSTLLAYTGMRGNSMPEVFNYLTLAASSDGTHPDGTVYLLENSNVRSQTREPYFRTTVAALEQRGRRAEILSKDKGQNGILPKGKTDVIGAVLGFSRFNWKKSKSRILPGAIVEALTSYGGHFNLKKQTKLSEFLRYGAAGSSGAVAEPYSFQSKFPVSHLHVYYADGSSLAEAFYQSIEGPYQLIVVGDPLARPFADFVDVTLPRAELKPTWQGIVTLQPKVISTAKHPLSRIELWVDGRHVATTLPNQSLTWDTQTVADGYHELRLVAIEATFIETRSYLRFAINITNTPHQLRVNPSTKTVFLGEIITVSGFSPEAKQVALYQGGRELGRDTTVDHGWSIKVPSAILGIGKLELLAQATYRNNAQVISEPITLEVTAPLKLSAKEQTKSVKTKQGLQAWIRDRSGNETQQVVSRLHGRLGLNKERLKSVAAMRLAGEFKVEQSGFYQLVVVSNGLSHIRIDHQIEQTLEATDPTHEMLIPVSLEAGWHTIELTVEVSGRFKLQVLLAGETVTHYLAGDRLRH